MSRDAGGPTVFVRFTTPSTMDPATSPTIRKICDTTRRLSSSQSWNPPERAIGRVERAEDPRREERKGDEEQAPDHHHGDPSDADADRRDEEPGADECRPERQEERGRVGKQCEPHEGPSDREERGREGGGPSIPLGSCASEDPQDSVKPRNDVSIPRIGAGSPDLPPRTAARVILVASPTVRANLSECRSSMKLGSDMTLGE